MSTDLVVALDFDSEARAMRAVESFSGEPFVAKVGLELFIAAGSAIVRRLQDRGLRVFLDLKLHDIPHTVAQATHRAADLGVDFLTIHAAGGPKMVATAVNAIESRSLPTKLLAVTVLTSFDEDEWERVGRCIGATSTSAASAAEHLGALAIHAGAHGLVCSAHEVSALRAKFSNAYLMVPGIRPVGSAVGDQARVMTPAQAKDLGASGIVVGRPITQASDPVAVIRQIRGELR